MKIAIPELGTPQPNYPKALRMLGAETVQITDGTDPQGFDGLLLPGGADLNPSRYGCENLGSLGIDDELDELQFSALESFLAAGKPVLGICRGHQLIAAHFGGKLIQHLPTFNHHTVTDGEERERFHTVIARPDSWLAETFGSEFTVNSTHHQAAVEAKGGLQILAVSDDGVIEALGHRTLPVFSVQWHPERMCGEYFHPDRADGAQIFRRFLDSCAK